MNGLLKTGADHSFEGLLRDMDKNNVERAVMIGHWVIDEGLRDGPFTNRTNNDLIHTGNKNNKADAAMRSFFRISGLYTDPSEDVLRCFRYEPAAYLLQSGSHRLNRMHR